MENKLSIFRYISYVEIMKVFIESNHKTYGYKAQMAKAADCHRSYISQVLNESIQLTIEQAVGLAVFWNLTEIEKDYFINLVSYARAGNEKTRKHFRNKIDQARHDQANLTKRIQEKTILPEASAAIFYSNWQYLAITILISIPQYRSVKEIAHRLNLSEELVKKTLNQLLELGTVTNSGNEWFATNYNIHIPRESQFNSLNHSHWRQKAVQNSFLSLPDDVHYTSVCTLSLTDVQNMKELMLQFIDQTRKIVAPSKEEEIYCLTCDWFKV